MKRLFGVLLAVGLCLGSTAFGMPLAPIRARQAVDVVQAEYGCGLGVRRGPLGACTPVYGYEGYGPYFRGCARGYYRGYRRGYYDGHRAAAYPYVGHYDADDVIVVDRGACELGSYLSCSYGTCWRFCY